MRTSIELLLPRPELVTIPDGQYSEHLESIIQSVWQHARKYLEMAKETQKLYYDMDVVPSIISPGDRVFKHSPAGKPGLATKLLRHWIGPYEVLEVSPTNALGESTQTGFPEVFSGPKTWAAETIRWYTPGFEGDAEVGSPLLPMGQAYRSEDTSLQPSVLRIDPVSVVQCAAAGAGSLPTNDTQLFRAVILVSFFSFSSFSRTGGGTVFLHPFEWHTPNIITKTE